MRIRAVLQEFEAHFHPVQPDAKVRGKSEWKRYSDGTYRFKGSVRDLPLPDGSRVYLWRGDSWFMPLAVQDHAAKVDLESESGSAIPPIEAGQVLQIRSGETVLAEGEYKAE